MTSPACKYCGGFIAEPTPGGVPVVTTVPQATRRLHDGDLVTVDADRGVVRVVEYGSRSREPEAVLDRLERPEAVLDGLELPEAVLA